MKNYIFTKSSTLLSFDKENITEFSTIDNTYGGIDWMFPIPEDGIFSFSKEDTYEVKAGDIVYIMYPAVRKGSGYEREVIINSNKELYDYYLRCKAQEEKENSNYTKRSLASTLCAPCEPCCNVCNDVCEAKA